LFKPPAEVTAELSTWILLCLLSGLLLGCYDIAKKASVKDNAVPPVLLLSVLTGAAVWLFLLGMGALTDSTLTAAWSLGIRQHGLLLLKSVMVGASWSCAFFGLKHLPISVATPIRATSPVWTILLAVVAMGERPAPQQWLGISVVLVAFFAFSRVGVREGIHFHRDRWVMLMLAATLLGSLCALYDKYLLQIERLSPVAVQAWFSIYLVPVMLPLWIRWYRRDRKRTPFEWRWSIPMIAALLLVSDYVYFTAVADPEALISVVSPLRRASVVVSFVFGIVQLKEKNWRIKALCIGALLLGVYWLSVGSH
jgi:transporter family protein